MQISGHRTQSVYQRYDIVSEEDMKAPAQGSPPITSSWLRS
jgi:hypothetical protein